MTTATVQSPAQLVDWRVTKDGSRCRVLYAHDSVTRDFADGVARSIDPRMRFLRIAAHTDEFTVREYQLRED